MITEKEFMTSIAEIILSVFDNPNVKLTQEKVCSDGHVSPKMFTPERLLRMRSDTLMRLLLYLATAMNEPEFDDICKQLFRHITDVGNNDVDSAYDIFDCHAGSPINRKAPIVFV